jgi:hypothetical protein
MEINFGKHAGKSVEILLLKKTDYIVWMLLQKNATGQMASAQKEARRLIAIFDQKPFVKTCYGHNCNNAATRCSVYNINVQGPYWWCNTCNPYQSGAVQGKLQEIKTYAEAVSHVDFYCRGRKSDYQALIKSMAEAKGLPSRVGNVQAEKFFSAVS